MNPLAHSCQSITTQAAMRAAEAAVAHGRHLGVTVNAAVVDHSGVLMAFLRCEGAPLHSVDIAIDKAYTAVSFGLPTAAWDARLAERSEAVRAGLYGRPRFAGFGGGLPIMLHGQRIGAIGISGASEAQDIACAEAGLAAILPQG
ncbi:heme-binding protein [Vogesella sp. LIG4]|uniref:Heme-binding protein n=1 Tax=Vogesella facilis TaxID=1655232 RepID=A0ABV7RKW3_9NEIS|nr:heme-binding protein [Vogesella sp. LIG4]SCK16506.1 Uncharacterized conserved protein GlcG, DUF336 family [Vogesella sp. LIG4]